MCFQMWRTWCPTCPSSWSSMPGTLFSQGRLLALAQQCKYPIAHDALPTNIRASYSKGIYEWDPKSIEWSVGDRLSCGRLIWLLSLPPTLLTVSWISFSVFLWVAGRAFRQKARGAGEEPNRRPRESLALCKLFNTLWLRPCEAPADQ